WRQRQASAALENTSTGSGAHLVHGTVLLFPVGTHSHGTGQQDSLGKVHEVLATVLAPTGRIGKAPRLLAEVPSSPPHHCRYNSVACDGLHWSADPAHMWVSGVPPLARQSRHASCSG